MSALETMMPKPQFADLGDVRLAYYEVAPKRITLSIGRKARRLRHSFSNCSGVNCDCS